MYCSVRKRFKKRKKSAALLVRGVVCGERHERTITSDDLLPLSLERCPEKLCDVRISGETYDDRRCRD